MHSVGDHFLKGLLVVIVFFFTSSRSICEDWPMWRYDAGRTAVTPQVLSDDLKPIWIRELRKPVPAWPANQLKLRFDESYEPIVLGGTLFVPSMTSDCLIAFDTDSGQENWRFYTEGPIRFAPVGHLDSVIFASDDGFLYAVHSQTGQLQWKFRGGPAERRILGNNRLVSTWPVRGAPVLYDGIVYFGAGIWSSMGIFIHAVDAGT
ncbi:MAG TPA: hypothetical protein EYG38_16235, partial [Verrucomicrobia bacterium]|nr:hypothetical protein [Verrucomicrobiota bacterium]